jgi:photosystem II stability/assembly factor-like uncharacterized protein
MGPSASTVQHMLVDSAEPLFLYVGNSQLPSMGGYRSAPYFMNVQPGLIWSPLALADGTLLSAISVSPTQSGHVYAGACAINSGGVAICQYYRSSDFGATWALVYTPPGNVVLLSIVEAPTASSTLYAAGNRSSMGGGPGAFVAKSSDGGSTWTDISAGLPGGPDANSNGLGSIVVDPTNASVVYVGTQAGVYKTSNGGTAWASSGAGIPSGLVTALIINPTTANQLFAGVGPTQQNSFAGAGIYMSSNGGITWSPANMGLTSLKVLSLAFDSRGPSILWAGTGDGGVFESTDGGATWNAVNNGLAGVGSLDVTAIASSQVAGSDDVFIGTGNGTFTMSIASGQTEAVIEYYAAKQDHYFMSAGAAEIQALDNGTIPGWVRTGQSFKAYSQAGPGIDPVCRFYIPPAKGDSHFYSALPTECAAILDAATNPANPLHGTYVGFIEESPGVFFVGIPSAGQCAAGTLPVYRLWNQRPDTNHRYTTSTTIRDQMVSLGYADEGVVMCAPQ